MNDKVKIVLELNKIIDLLATYTSSDITKRKISELEPMHSKRMIEYALTETTEAVSVIMYKGSMPIGNIEDISEIVSMARKGRCLTAREILAVKKNLSISSQVKKFLKEDMPDGIKIISEIVELIESLTRLENDINDAIVSEDEISDNATPELRNIRRDIRNKNDLIKSRLQKMITSSSAKQHLQDAIVTMRNGRYVLPVKKEYQGVISGMVHDQSSSGATLFIEPQSVVNLNNELKQLASNEQAEITRILQSLSDRIAENSIAILNNQKLLTELDFINCKGKLSIDMDAIRPKLNDKSIIEIFSGRHPLLNTKNVVPINVSLGKDYTTLLITGPNTGGKTVTLKTIGLLILMTQCGLHIPAAEPTNIPILDEIFADIGDEQSIEQSLSTFSSHMKNIISIFERAGENSLVLLDELGAGTDPLEGAALGIAELEKLKSMSALVVATTHYTELKKYALVTEGVENASMEFSIETLSPTYKLRVGIPGKSNAFEISKKLGLSTEIIERATELLGKESIEFERAVSRVEEDRLRAEDLLRRADMEYDNAKLSEVEAEKRLLKAEEEADKIISEATDKAKRIIIDANAKVDEISADLKDMINSVEYSQINSGHITGKVANSRRKLKKAEKELSENNKTGIKNSLQTGKIPNKDDIKLGMAVKYVKIDQNGEVLSLPDASGNMVIRIGIIKMTVNIKDLIVVQSENAGNKERKKQKYTKISYTKAKEIKTEINLIGKNLDEAIDIMDKYIDDAFIAGLNSVNVIHGRGEGILRQGLREHLKHNKQVKSIKSATYNQGGEGCTVVDLKSSK